MMDPENDTKAEYAEAAGRLAAAGYVAGGLPEPYFETDDVAIYHGDCREILPRIAPGSIDLVLTDPPYSSGGMYRADRSKSTAAKYQLGHETHRTYAAFAGDNRDQRSFEKWCDSWMSECLKLAREGTGLGCFIDWRNVSCVIDAVQVAGWVYQGLLPWYKGSDQRPIKGWFRRNVEFIVMATAGPVERGPSSDGICQDGMLDHRINGADKLHQTQKPTGVFADIMRTRPDWQTLLDPFMGSGSALVAARGLGRKAVGIEMEERYCEVAARRLSQTDLFSAA